MSRYEIRNSIYSSLLTLFTEEGINASSKNEVFGCIFGRDSAITILKILKFLKNPASPEFVDKDHLIKVCKTGLSTLISLQGKGVNIESGEEPGKFIHEYRKENFEHLVNRSKPWFVYPDGTLKNYDSIDSTALTLIAIHKFWKETGDNDFLLQSLSAVKQGLEWIINFGDKDGDGLIEYTLPDERKYGGLPVQSWTDSHESLLNKSGKFPKYPIAPVEAQAFAWLALKLWSDFYHNKNFSLPEDQTFSLKLRLQAEKIKSTFNLKFVFKSKGLTYLAQALDGSKNKIKVVTANPLLIFWAVYESKNGNEIVLDEKYSKELVKRAFMKDLFDENAGIRTMSSSERMFNPGQNSYHNGSFWPMLNGLIHEGLVKWGFSLEAELLKEASLKPIDFFQSPIELYIRSREGVYQEFNNGNGQTSCREQAWSAAALLDLLTL